MNNIFNLKEKWMASVALFELRRAARGNTLLIPGAVFALILLAGLLTLDYEINFRLFEFLAGEDALWTPSLMALTPAIALVAFHVLIRHSPNHPLLRIMRTLSAFCVAAFVIGCGTYIASILYIDTGAPVAPEIAIPTLGEVTGAEAPQTNWLDTLFREVTSPFGVLTLSLGIGGLSVISVYAGHQLLSIIEHALCEVTLTRRKLREGIAHHRASLAAEARFAELADAYDRLMAKSDEALLAQIAGLVLRTIDTHAIPHEKRLQQMRFASAETLLDPDHSAEIKRVEEALKPIRAITAKDVISALSPTTTTTTTTSRKAK